MSESYFRLSSSKIIFEKVLTRNLNCSKMPIMNIIKAYRKRNGVSVAQMADALKISKQHIYEIERGSSYPSRKLAKAIEDFTSGEIRAAEILLV